jgi:hypothetical protein
VGGGGGGMGVWGGCGVWAKVGNFMTTLSSRGLLHGVFFFYFIVYSTILCQL